ncbi:MAG: phosphoglucosamine mutase [Alphaproteobacteria bacterium]|nr:phosphoglucosamine mutase [Alphaproteobacteria bacterium]
MTKKYFGTDGIRGTANRFPMTADMALKVAMSAAIVLKSERNGKHQNRVVIGKDTRLSGYMLEQAMAAGFTAMGLDVILVGPIPTPGIAMLTRSLRADMGVMISASHNPFQDNGIKFFGADGYKLSDELEVEIEAQIDKEITDKELPPPDQVGKAKRLEDATGRYIEYIKRSFPRGKSLEGLKVVVDCANGAAYKVAPQILWELEADVITIGNKPNGRNINDGYGATATQRLQTAVVDHGFDVGIALDGDADRLIVVDEKGTRIDGDQIMALLAVQSKNENMLNKDTVVATVMSNLGLEKFLETQNIKLLRTPVGDRHVVEAMREGDYNLGGEQSGHLVLSDFGTTGDGTLAALQVLSILKDSDKPSSEILSVFKPLPQVLKNVHYGSFKPLENKEILQEIEKAEKALANTGRMLVRLSGTEPVIRVMAEGEDQAFVESVVNDVCEMIEKLSKAS